MRIAVIGTRSPASDMGLLIHDWCKDLTLQGNEVSTGGAKGVDQWAMMGAASGDVGNLHVFLPWRSFNNGIVPEGCNVTVFDARHNIDWVESVRLYHPRPDALTHGATLLHARNYGIVACPKPVDAVIALPKSRWDLGGTGQGMRVAEGLGIKVYNLLESGVISQVDNAVSKGEW